MKSVCDECRKKNYCAKTCRRKKEQVTQIIKGQIWKTFIEGIMSSEKVLKEVMKNER